MPIYLVMIYAWLNCLILSIIRVIKYGYYYYYYHHHHDKNVADFKLGAKIWPIVLSELFELLSFKKSKNPDGSDIYLPDCLIFSLLLISFKIRLYFLPKNLRFKFTDSLFCLITIPASLVSRHLSFFWFISVYWGSLIACCFLVSGTRVHFVMYYVCATSCTNSQIRFGLFSLFFLR